MRCHVTFLHRLWWLTNTMLRLVKTQNFYFVFSIPSDYRWSWNSGKSADDKFCAVKRWDKYTSGGVWLDKYSSLLSFDRNKLLAPPTFSRKGGWQWLRLRRRLIKIVVTYCHILISKLKDQDRKRFVEAHKMINAQHRLLQWFIGTMLNSAAILLYIVKFCNVQFNRNAKVWKTQTNYTDFL